MLDSPEAVFSSGSLVPHGYCYLWKTGLVGLHVTADALITLAYYSIPIALFYVVWQRKDLPFKWMFLLFATFIAACGTTHLLDIWTLWYPAYWLAGGVKALTALTSTFAAIELVSMIPKVLALPSPDDLRQLNAEFQQQQQFLRQVIDSNPSLIFVKDWDGRFALANQALADVYNTTIENLIGKTDVDFCQNLADAEQYAQADRQVMRTLQPLLNLEESFTTPEGTIRYFQSTKQPLISSGDEIRYVLGVANDITTLKQIEAALQQKTEELETFFSSVLDLLCIATVDGQFLRLNPEWNRTLGYEVSELEGRQFLDFVHPEDLDSTLAAMAQLSEQQPILSFINRYCHQDGSYRWLEWRAVPKGRYIYAAARDISDRKRAEAEQESQKAFLRQVIDTVPNVIFVKDAEGRFLIVNQAGADVHGATVEAMIGRRETDVNPNFSAAELQEFLTINREAMRTRQPHTHLSQMIRTATGETRWYQTMIKPLTNVDGQVTGIVGATTDVTTLKHTEQELQQAKEAAEAANRAKSLFLANMSHELRTPLNVILGFTQVMGRDERLTVDQRENLRSIQRSGDHLLSLINDVLDLSKIEAGHTTIDEQSVDLTELLRSLAQMFRQRAEAKGLQLHLEIASSVPPYITIDASKLRQILINLLGNAIKFTNQGHVTLRVEARNGEWDAAHHADPSSLPQSIRLHVEVLDTGSGIDAAELGSIFSAFVQTQAGKDSPEGTGLGLTICQRFVQMMGGDITVRSSVGQGSTFAFTIPAQVARSHDVPPASTARRVIGLAPDQPMYRILVVDDQAENRRLLVTLLNQIGFTVKEAATGEEAVAQWQQWHPHLIYMDVRMPGLNGYEATRQIRALGNGQTPIIIALTAQASEGDRALALASGCNDYLSKPFQDGALFNQMAEHLGLAYLYEADPIDASSMDAPEPSITLDPSDLLAMSSAWITALRRAALLCDDGSVEELIEQIPPERALLIKGLHQLVQRYSFKQIVALTTSGATDDDA